MSSNKKCRVPVTIICGYLGSGKTTLLKYILKNDHGYRLAIVQNEFSNEMGIESPLLTDMYGQTFSDIFELPNGCICCSARNNFVAAIEKLLVGYKNRFDYIVVETTGVSDPQPIICAFWLDKGLQSLLELDGILTVVDARNFLKNLGSTTSQNEVLSVSQNNDGEIFYTFMESPSRGTLPIGSSVSGLFVEILKQIAYADVIVLNKIDSIGEFIYRLPDEIQDSLDSKRDSEENIHFRLKSVIDVSNEFAVKKFPKCEDTSRICSEESIDSMKKIHPIVKGKTKKDGFKYGRSNSLDYIGVSHDYEEALKQIFNEHNGISGCKLIDILNVLRSVNSFAQIYLTEYSQVDLSLILNLRKTQKLTQQRSDEIVVDSLNNVYNMDGSSTCQLKSNNHEPYKPTLKVENTIRMSWISSTNNCPNETFTFQNVSLHPKIVNEFTEKTFTMGTKGNFADLKSRTFKVHKAFRGLKCISAKNFFFKTSKFKTLSNVSLSDNISHNESYTSKTQSDFNDNERGSSNGTSPSNVCSEEISDFSYRLHYEMPFENDFFQKYESNKSSNKKIHYQDSRSLISSNFISSNLLTKSLKYSDSNRIDPHGTAFHSNERYLDRHFSTFYSLNKKPSNLNFTDESSKSEDSYLANKVKYCHYLIRSDYEEAFTKANFQNHFHPNEKRSISFTTDHLNYTVRSSKPKVSDLLTENSSDSSQNIFPHSLHNRSVVCSTVCAFFSVLSPSWWSAEKFCFLQQCCAVKEYMNDLQEETFDLLSLTELHTAVADILWEKENGDIFRCKGICIAVDDYDECNGRWSVYTLQGVGDTFEIDECEQNTSNNCADLRFDEFDEECFVLTAPIILNRNCSGGIEHMLITEKFVGKKCCFRNKFLFIGRNIVEQNIDSRLKKAIKRYKVL